MKCLTLSVYPDCVQHLSSAQLLPHQGHIHVSSDLGGLGGGDGIVTVVLARVRRRQDAPHEVHLRLTDELQDGVLGHERQTNTLTGYCIHVNLLYIRWSRK